MRRLVLVGAVALTLVVGLTALASAQELAATPMPTLRVTPATDLVDGQVVTVTGAGWAAGTEVFLSLCGNPDYRCFLTDIAVADATGAFTLALTVRVLGPPSNWIDCRLEGCHLSARTRRGDPVIVPLGFDADAPVADTGVAEVSPAGALIDGQQVRVTGVGWTSESVAVQLCEHRSRVCDRYPRDAAVSPDGSFSVDVTVRARPRMTDGTIGDCRFAACEVRVGDDERRAILPVSFDPLAPLLAEQLSITPTGTLVNGQVVTVTGNGFLPGEQLLVRQRCYYAPDCGARVVPDADGRFSLTTRVQDVVDVYHGTSDCRGVGRCAIRVVEPNTWIEVANAPLTFAPEGHEQVTVQPSTGLEDGDVVHVDAVGLNRGHGVEVNQCVALPGNPFPFPYTDWRCPGPGLELPVDDAGEIHTSLQVRSRWASTSDEHPQPFDCRIDRCRLVVGGPGVRVYVGSTFSGYGTYWNRTPLTFAGDGAPPSTTPASTTPATPAFAG